MPADTIMGPVHPGEILLEEFLKPLSVSEYHLAKEIGVPARRINEIVHGERRLSADTALRLARFFGTSLRDGHRPAHRRGRGASYELHPGLPCRRGGITRRPCRRPSSPTLPSSSRSQAATADSATERGNLALSRLIWGSR
jgi:addiction module HigA family antidote